MQRAFLGLASLIAVGAGAATSAQAGDVGVSTTLGFESRYMFRGIQFAQSSFQPAVTVSLDGFYVSAWANLPVGDEDLTSFGGEEIDVIGGYSGSFNDFISYDIGVTYYTFPNLDDGFFDTYDEDAGTGANTLEPYIGLSFTAPLSPKIYFYRDFMFDTFTVQGSLSQSFPLSGGFSLDLSGSVGYVIDDDDGADYLYGQASANVSYAIGESSSIYAGARFGGSDIAGGSVIDDASLGTTQSNGFWFGFGLSTSF
ncbi:MAG: TorF family putative porin [Amphiplicatus sp.]